MKPRHDWIKVRRLLTNAASSALPGGYTPGGPMRAVVLDLGPYVSQVDLDFLDELEDESPPDDPNALSVGDVVAYVPNAATIYLGNDELLIKDEAVVAICDE